MKTIITIITFLIFLPNLSWAEETILAEANSFFSQAVDAVDQDTAKSLLDKALLRYEQLYRDQPSGRLAYNIGNTYYQLDNKPMALVYYKRAMQEIPNDTNLLHNMELVREELQLQSLAPETGFAWLPPFVKNRLHLIFLISYGLFWLTATIRYAKKPFMPLALPVTLLFLTLTCSTVIGMNWLQPAPQEGVITASDTLGRQGNGRSFEPSFNEPLAVGTEFIILEKRGYWLRIQLHQGEECWIPTRSCEVV